MKKTVVLPCPNKTNAQSCIILIFSLHLILAVLPDIQNTQLYDFLKPQVYTRVKIRKSIFKLTHHMCVLF